MLNHEDANTKLQQKYLQQNSPTYLWSYPQIHVHEPEGEVSAPRALAVKFTFIGHQPEHWCFLLFASC